MEAEAGPSRPRSLPRSPGSPARSPRSPGRSARISTSRSPVRAARLSVEVSVELPRLTPKLASPGRVVPERLTRSKSPTKSPTRPWPDSPRSPRSEYAPGWSSGSRQAGDDRGSGSVSPIRSGGLEHVVEALERAVDVPIERIKPPDAERARTPTRTPARTPSPARTAARDPSPGFDLTPLPTRLPPGFGFSPEPTPASASDPPARSSLRLPVDHTPQRRQPPISGPIYVPADVFALLTAPNPPPPSSAPVPLPTVAGHALRSAAPQPQPKPERSPVPRPVHSLQDRAYVCIKISERRRAELIARGVYDAFRDDEGQFRGALAPRRRHQHYAAGSNRIMVRNVPLVLARPEEMPERFVERPGPALLEPYASVLTEDRLVNTLGEYQCGWKGCGAVLASEERLRRHVAQRAHAAQGAVTAGGTVYRCFWGGCEGPCFERVEGLVQHLGARHVAGRLRCPFAECEMTSPTLAHLQRHAIRQHTADAALRPRADLPARASLPPLPPLPETAHADELCTHRVAGRQHASAFRQEQVRARIQRLCFGGPEPDTAVGGVTMMEQLALTPQPDVVPVRKRKRKNWGYSKKKYPSAVRVKAEPASDAEPPPKRAKEDRARETERYARWERKRLGRVWVEIPVRDPRKAGVYERPETPPPPPVTPGSAVERREQRERREKRAHGSEGGRRAEGFDTSVFDAFRGPAPSSGVSAALESEGDSEAEVELGVSFDPTPASSPSSASRSQPHAPPTRATATPNGHTAPRASVSASPASRKIPRHSVEVVLPRGSPMVIR